MPSSDATARSRSRRLEPGSAALAATCTLLLCGFDHRGYLPEQVDGCLLCHPRERPSHAVGGVAPGTPDLPLGLRGEVVCLSCHACDRANGACSLRGEPRALCRACHDCDHGMACLIELAHVGCDHSVEFGVRTCLTCHDGTIGPERGSRPGEHPLDVDYPASAAFEPVPDARVRLVERRVTCVACHDPYLVTRARLTIDNTRSRLCLACHRR